MLKKLVCADNIHMLIGCAEGVECFRRAVNILKHLSDDGRYRMICGWVSNVAQQCALSHEYLSVDLHQVNLRLDQHTDVYDPIVILQNTSVGELSSSV